MKNRSRDQIIYQVLQAASGGAIKTRIMYRSGLAHGQLMDYLLMLVENGMITYEPERKLHRTTLIGRSCMRQYEVLRQMMAPSPMGQEAATMTAQAI